LPDGQKNLIRLKKNQTAARRRPGKIFVDLKKNCLPMAGA